uniref:Uncharacterized protein n=1 Tax=Zea mays TaxID=4577 RepID=C4J7V8_MAIZE|nr:unknown [Zea mays]
MSARRWPRRTPARARWRVGRPRVVVFACRAFRSSITREGLPGSSAGQPCKRQSRWPTSCRSSGCRPS